MFFLKRNCYLLYMWVCIRRAQNKREFTDVGFAAPMSECYIRPCYDFDIEPPHANGDRTKSNAV